MLIYQVTITIDPDIDVAYIAWLRPHAQEVVALGNFTGVDIYKVSDTPEIIYVVQYHVPSQVQLNNYFQQHAPKLRAETMAKFGDKIRIERRVMEVV